MTNSILKKNFFLMKKFFLANVVKEYDNKNVIFFKYQEKIYPFKLEIAKAYLEKLKDKTEFDFQNFLYKLLFPT